MKTIDITSTPQIVFAHTYESNNYDNLLPPSKPNVEITYIAEGSLELTIENQKYVAQTGDILCLFRNEEITVHASDFHRHHTFGVNLEWNYLENNTRGLFLPVLTKFSPQVKEIHQMIDDIIYNSHRYEGIRARQTTQVMNILCKIDLYNRNSKELQLPGELLLAERAKKYVHSHMYEAITQTDVANHLKITPTHLCRIFKKTQGTSFMRYVNKTKLENMKNLIERENLHVYEAAELFGYTDPNYVSSLHKKLFGYNITDKPPVHPPI